MTACLLSLGGNQGDVTQTFDLAVQRLAESPKVVVQDRSGRHRTKAVGVDAGDEFFNAALLIHTSLSPLELLDLLQAVETELGRERSVRWGPRTLDLDLLFYGSEILREPRLRVPHPACSYRRFVLDPLVEIAPDFEHPEKKVSISELRRRLLVRPLPVSVLGQMRSSDQRLNSLQPLFPDVEFHDIRGPQDVLDNDEGLLVRVDSSPLPMWANMLTTHIGWVDVSDSPGDRRQRLIDILLSAGILPSP